MQDGGVVAEDKREVAVEAVSGTCWEGDIAVAKRKMSQLFDIAGLEMVMHRDLTSRVTPYEGQRRPTVTGDENATYSSLVESTGF